MNKQINTKNMRKTFIILGDNKTGKSSILQKFTKKKFYEIYKETCGTDFFSKEIKLNEVSTNQSTLSTNLTEDNTYIFNNNVELYLWDTNGLENIIKIIPSNLYKNTHGFLICCSYDSLSSLQNVKLWVNHIKENYFWSKEKNDLPVLILCNKFDIPPEQKQFDEEQIQIILKEFLMISEFKIKIYHKISAKENLNIDYVFNRMTILASRNSPCNIINSSKDSEDIYPNPEKSNKNDLTFDLELVNKDNDNYQHKNSFVLPSNPHNIIKLNKSRLYESRKNCVSSCCK